MSTNLPNKVHDCNIKSVTRHSLLMYGAASRLPKPLYGLFHISVYILRGIISLHSVQCRDRFLIIAFLEATVFAMFTPHRLVILPDSYSDFHRQFRLGSMRIITSANLFVEITVY